MAHDNGAWRAPQHTDDESIGADDGTRWVYSPSLQIWAGWQPGEDGLWERTTDEMRTEHPEVVAYLNTVHVLDAPDGP